MALLFEESTCSLCNKRLKDSGDIIAWASFLTKEHKFWKYSDSGMHKACFEKWEHKLEFEELYKYQPTIDFDALWVKEVTKMYGMPDWLKEIKAYRAKND